MRGGGCTAARPSELLASSRSNLAHPSELVTSSLSFLVAQASQGPEKVTK